MMANNPEHVRHLHLTAPIHILLPMQRFELREILCQYYILCFSNISDVKRAAECNQELRDNWIKYKLMINSDAPSLQLNNKNPQISFPISEPQ